MASPSPLEEREGLPAGRQGGGNGLIITPALALVYICQVKYSTVRYFQLEIGKRLRYSIFS
jgi:hypothetical protein